MTDLRRPSVQRSRRHNPYPLSWEVPTALVVGVALLLVVGLQAGRSVANLIAGNGWVFVNRTEFLGTLSGLLRGDAGAGLDAVTHPAGSGLIWTCVAIVEAVIVIAVAAATKWGLGRWGPGRWHGMATPDEVETLLGRSRLRKHAKVVRPDLHSASRRDHP